MDMIFISHQGASYMNVLRYLSSCVLLCRSVRAAEPTTARRARTAAARCFATTIRDYAGALRDQVAKACLDLEWTLPGWGRRDVATAQTGLGARAARV